MLIKQSQIKLVKPEFLKGTVVLLTLRPTRQCSVLSGSLKRISEILKEIRHTFGKEYCFYTNQIHLRKYNLLYIHLPIKPSDILNDKTRLPDKTQNIRNLLLSELGYICGKHDTFTHISKVSKKAAINIKFGYIDCNQRLNGNYGHYVSIRRFNKKMIKIEPNMIYDD